MCFETTVGFKATCESRIIPCGKKNRIPEFDDFLNKNHHETRISVVIKCRISLVRYLSHKLARNSLRPFGIRQLIFLSESAVSDLNCVNNARTTYDNN
jgi:hypothetical protein